jgi:hypothetical protein
MDTGQTSAVTDASIEARSGMMESAGASTGRITFGRMQHAPYRRTIL